MFCHSCGREATNLKPVSAVEELMLCTRCRRSLKSVAKDTGTTVRERWQSLFHRTTRKR